MDKGWPCYLQNIPGKPSLSFPKDLSLHFDLPEDRAPRFSQVHQSHSDKKTASEVCDLSMNTVRDRNYKCYPKSKSDPVDICNTLLDYTKLERLKEL
ncbi:unnamed protein product [Nezara viridula]|uniref:Uncharacterized protein n=1 Tax=Nezara viridula TaxID=85310 RepID=A0A9P0H299_NEZVI|nr:unnamed protein product [Nezara viridula]